jgi:hypothetical protein
VSGRHDLSSRFVMEERDTEQRQREHEVDGNAERMDLRGSRQRGQSIRRNGQANGTRKNARLPWA